MSQSIPISGLDPLSQISSSDYIPIVQNTSTTTFKAPLVILANWMSASVQTSSSLSTLSSSYALSASWANNAGSSSYSVVSSNLIYPNTSTAQNAISASFAKTASWAPYPASASWASQSFSSTSASFAKQALSASWAPVPVSASWASASLTTTSASWANNSGNSSTSVTASYALNAGSIVAGSGFIFLTQPVIMINIQENEGSGGWYNTGVVPDNSITVASTRGSLTYTDGWYTFNLSGSGIPNPISQLIIEASSNTEWGDGSTRAPFFVFVRDNVSSLNSYAVLRTGVGYGGNAGQVAHTQGIYPVGLNGSFQWRINNASFVGRGIYIRIVGYIR